MPRLGWHKRVEESLEEVGEDWGYEILRPRVIHFSHHDSLQFEYHPDVCWLYRGRAKKEPNAVVWEIESRFPDFKRVCGDALLSGLVVPDYVECYPWKEDTSFGSELEDDVEIPLYGKTRRTLTYRKGERVLIKPYVKAFFLIVEDYEEDFQRYLDTIQEIMGIHADTRVFSLARGLYKSEMIRRLKTLKRLREKYKP